MNVTPVTFHSEGFELVGDQYIFDRIRPGERRARIVLCPGCSGGKDLYPPETIAWFRQHLPSD